LNDIEILKPSRIDDKSIHALSRRLIS